MIPINELLAFGAGKLPVQRAKEVQQIILDHPFYFEVLANLNRIKKSLPANTDVQAHLELGKDAHKTKLSAK